MGKLALAQYRAARGAPRKPHEPRMRKPCRPRLLRPGMSEPLEPLQAELASRLKPGVCANCEALLVKGLTVDVLRGGVAWVGGAASLPPGPLKIMHALLSKPRTNEQLIHALWGDRSDGGPEGAPAVVKVHICRLRAELAAAGFPGRIEGNHGVGYYIVFSDQPKQESSMFVDLSPPVEGGDSKVKFAPMKHGKTKITISAALMQAHKLSKGSKVRVQIDMGAATRTLRIFADERGAFTMKGTRGGKSGAAAGTLVISNGAFPALFDKVAGEAIQDGEHLNIFLPAEWQLPTAQSKPIEANPVGSTQPAMVDGKPTQSHPWRNGGKRAAA